MNSKKKYLIDLILGTLFVLFIVILFIPYIELLDGGKNRVGLFSFMQVLTTNTIVGSTVVLRNSVLYALITALILLISAFFYLLALYKKIVGNTRFYTKYLLVGLISFIIANLLIAFGPFIYKVVDDTAYKVKSLWYFGLSLFLVSGAIILITLGEISDKERYTVREIAETAILVALAVVLDQFLKISLHEDGGSINLSAIPLFIIAIRYGGFKGFIASSIFFGLTTCLADGYGIQTYPFDYLIAFSGYGLVGTFFNLFSKINPKKDEQGFQFLFGMIGILVASVPVMVIRYIGSMLSGAILYGPISFVDNFIYQSAYIPLSVVVSIAGTIALLYPLILINKVFPPKIYKPVNGELSEEGIIEEIDIDDDIE